MVSRLLILFLLALSVPILAKPINITTGEWPPFVDENAPEQGCVAKLVRDALRLEGYAVNFHFMPWERAFVEGSKPNYVGTAYWFYSKARAKTYLYSKHAITYEVNLFYYNKNKPITIKGFDELSNEVLILSKGLTYPSELLNIIEKRNIPLIQTTYTTQNLALLLAGRGDITVLTAHTADTYLKSLPDNLRNQVVAHTTPAFTMAGYMLFNRANPDVAVAFDVGMAKLLDDENYLTEYQTICPPLPASIPPRFEGRALQ
ncbi:ABC-type amino acid transport/signal transduction systems, periplasmic component/domain [Pseudoalteromonas luteoviolacea B = ATCC 29581]|nr:ABC-type amino acid transport/signal transduction systems, periplasmic component/domain [Pseudoalteromonas luteoviolacea B = ATCC 29581]